MKKRENDCWRYKQRNEMEVNLCGYGFSMKELPAGSSRISVKGPSSNVRYFSRRSMTSSILLAVVGFRTRLRG
jgi:hypothetical protein